jgi:hypothetical protein
MIGHDYLYTLNPDPANLTAERDDLGFWEAQSPVSTCACLQ